MITELKPGTLAHAIDESGRLPFLESQAHDAAVAHARLVEAAIRSLATRNPAALANLWSAIETCERWG